MTREQSSKALVRGLAPAGMVRPARWLYVLLRLAYLLATAAALPLALLYAKRHDEGFANLPHWLGWVLAVGCMLWAMLHVVLGSYGYPRKLSWALFASVSLAATGFTGAALAEFSVGYAAYHLLICALCAQFLFFCGITAGSAARRWLGVGRSMPEVDGWYIGFLLVATVALGTLLLALRGPLLRELGQEQDLALFLAALGAFGARVFAEDRALYDASILNPGVMSDPLQNALHERWVGLAAVALIGTLLAALVVAVF